MCSGIEAATVAWHPLGWQAAAFAEIEKFPRAVLQHHYPDTPLHGDFTTIGADDYGPIDLLVGGTPCQSFSVAGLRKGLADPRGNLALAFLALLERTRAKWVVWENVPGVLSSNSGRDFGAFLGALGELGYGWTYRVLDAQFFGVPQRRRRVFVVGHLGDWRRAAAVLSERQSLQGHPAPRREKGEEVAGTFKSRARSGGWSQDVDLAASGYMRTVPESIPAVSASLNAHAGRIDAETETLISQERAVSENLENGPGGKGFQEGIAYTLEARNKVQAVAFKPSHCTRDKDGAPSNVCPPLTKEADRGDQDPVLFSIMPQNSGKDHKAREVDIAQPIMAAGPTGGSQGGDYLLSEMAVRRLTPRECERLQGFPDDYTQIPWRGKPAEECPDGPRYKALGNSMAVPVMRWIGERIQMVEGIPNG